MPSTDIFREVSARVLAIGGAVAVIDGAVLGGIAALISAIGALVLGSLTFWSGHRKGHSTGASEAEAWRMLAESRERELEESRRRLALYEAPDGD